MVVLAWRPTAEIAISGMVLATMKHDRRGDREGEGQIDRIGRPGREDMPAARAARLRARRERRDVLQQITIGAGNSFHDRGEKHESFGVYTSGCRGA